MKHVYTGKTKNVYQMPDGAYLLQFKDDVTGENGVFDPGANQIGLSLEGAGLAGLRLSVWFFELLGERGIPTHYLGADLEAATMTVQAARPFGKGVEVICRYRAVGSFLRRYGMYVQEGEPLDAFVEFSLKDDLREDPPISEDGLEMLGLLTADECGMIKEQTRRICGVIREALSEKGIELYDIKLEFGRIGENGEIILIDEISGGNMRAYKDGSYVEPLQLARLVLAGD